MGQRRAYDRWLPWLLIGILATSCTLLAYLQYRWTGELTRAETVSLQATLRAQTAQLATAFDTELLRTAAEYIPSARELERDGFEAAHQHRFRQAQSRSLRPLFRQIAIARPEGEELRFFSLDPATGTPRPEPWPESWAPLRQHLDAMRRRMFPGPPPPISVMEVPVFDGPGDGPPLGPGRREVEWMLFALDRDYVRQTWIPNLLQTYLNASDERRFSVEITERGPSRQLVFRDPAATPNRAPDAEAGMFPPSLLPGEGGMRGPMRGFGMGRRGPPPGREFREPLRGAFRWQLRVWLAAGSIEEVAEATRQRNLAVAFVLLGLIGVAGVLIIRNAARSRQLANAQFQFVAGVSHELRTPLTVIRGAAQNLLSGVVSDPAHRTRYLEMIVRHADQLTGMVEQLLSYASVTGNAATPASQRASVTVELQHALDLLQPLLAEKGAQVTVEGGDLPEVAIDPMSLRRVLQNLLHNAVTHGGGEIKVRMRVAGKGVVEAEVADSGAGISEADLPHIFDPFYRGKRALDSTARGTGLGLSLVRELLTAVGGSVEARSEPGTGAIFTIRIPIV